MLIMNNICFSLIILCICMANFCTKKEPEVSDKDEIILINDSITAITKTANINDTPETSFNGDISDSANNVAANDTAYQFLEKYPIEELPSSMVLNYDSTTVIDTLTDEQEKLLNLTMSSNPTYIFWIIKRLHVSPKFKTIIMGCLPNPNEVYAELINYDTRNQIVGSERVAYEETTGGCLRYESKIENNSIELTSINNCVEAEGNPDPDTINFLFDIVENGDIK